MSAYSPLTVHLALLGEDDLAAAARRVDGHRLEEALLDVWTPDALARLRALVVFDVRAQLAGLAGVQRVRGEVVTVGVGRRRAADAALIAAARSSAAASVVDARYTR